jgi:TM2 domain-containing membrane protein YozV
MAAVLNFFFPGVGHMYAGHIFQGLIFLILIPVLYFAAIPTLNELSPEARRRNVLN